MALLIANHQFHNKLDDLYAPSSDVDLLQEDLEKIGFYVMKLVNLTQHEIQCAIKGLKNIMFPNVYAFVYLGGKFHDHKLISYQYKYL